MVYKGTVKNGTVLLPVDVHLPEGVVVEVATLELSAQDDPFLAAVQKVTKPRPHWPRNYASNIDKYLYGVAKPL